MTTRPDTSTSLYAKYAGNPAENYEKYFVPAIGMPFARRLLATANLAPGERVLDVACGTGVVTRLAAAAVGPTGVTAGLDPVPPMLHAARTASPAGIEWHQAPAESMPLPDASFDAVLCSMGLQFFGDKVRGLQEMRRVLAPGGRVVVATPGPTPPLMEEIGAALENHLGPHVAQFVHTVFSVHDPDEALKLFTAAGLDDTELATETIPLRLAAPAEFLWQYLQSTPLAAATAEMDEGARAALERDVVGRCERFCVGSTIAMDTGVLVITGRQS